MNNTIKITLLAISYNHERFIKEALSSVLDQNWANIQWIIIDDCSTDNSVAAIKDFLDTHNIEATCSFHKENMGLATSLNEGLDLATGDYLQILACDDVLLPSKWEVQSEIMRTESSVACFSDFSSINEYGKEIESNYFPSDYTFPDNVFKGILHGHKGLPIVTHSPTGLLHTETIREIGGYRTDLMQEDFYMWLRVSSKYKISFTPKVLVAYRVLERSLSKELLEERRIKYLEDHLTVLESLTELAGDQVVEVESAKLNRLEKLLNTQLNSENGSEKNQKIFEQIEERVSQIGNIQHLQSFRKRNYWKAYKHGVKLDPASLKDLEGLGGIKKLLMKWGGPIQKVLP